MPLVVLPFGLHPLGLGVPPVIEALPPPPVIAAEKFSTATKDIESVLESADVVDAQVQLALSRLRRSGASVATTGQRFQDVRKLDDQAAVLLEQEARTSLALLVARGDIRIDGISIAIESAGAWAELTVDYINNRRSRPEKTSATVTIRPEATG